MWLEPVVLEGASLRMEQLTQTHAADLWYGFHVLLLPLAALDDLVKGIYLGAWATTVLALGLVYLAVSRLGLRWPALEPTR